MSSHIIVYLDQNYLSNMAIARHGFMKGAEAVFWRSLFDDLKTAVLADKIACPVSEFHSTEAMYDTRLEEPIREVIDKLSWGLEFHPWRSILESQIEDAAKVFLGKQIEKRECWVTIFQSNPQAPIESRMQDISGTRVRVNVHITLPKEVVEQDRKGKEEFVNIAQELVKDYSKKPLAWSKLVLESKKSTIDGFMGKLAIYKIIQGWQSVSVLDQISAQDNYIKLLSLFARLTRIGIDPDNQDMVMKFIESKELRDSPFIDIYSSIWAAIAECHRLQGRNIKGSDFYDVPILASALPFCDVIATDGFMKEITVNLLHFDDKYKAKIFSATKADRLAFQKFIQEL